MRAKKTKYLPQFPAESSESYEHRLNTATLFNMTAKTVEVMTGLVFAKPVTLSEETPDAIKDIQQNINNKGDSLTAFCAEVFSKQFEGHVLVLVDSPNERAESLRDQQEQNLRPYLTCYDANSVINWHFAVNDQTKAMELVLLVLKEESVELNGFEATQVVYYREYRKTDAGIEWYIYKQTANNAQIALESQGILAVDRIPAEFIYGLKKGEGISCPPLLDLALKNIEHWQSYSDYKSLIHKTNVPMFYTVNHSGDKPSHIGGDVWWDLGENGEAGWAEVEGGALAGTRTSLEDVKIEMGQLGLSMLAAKPGGDITATEALLNSVQETSQLQRMAMNLKVGLDRSLQMLDQYAGGIGEGSIELGTKWAEMILSNEQLAEFSRMVTDGNFSLESFLYNMERSGNLPPDVTAEDEAERLRLNPNSGAVGRVIDQAQRNALTP